MKPAESRRRRQVRCSGCRQLTPSYDIIHTGSAESGYRKLCSQCFNTEAAKVAELEGFEHVRFEPVVLTDCMGQPHEFHFRTRLFPVGVALDALELRGGQPAGYEFQINGDPTEDLLVLLGRLIAKIRRALSTKYLKDTTLGLQIADQVVQGRIEWDPDDDRRVPLLVIDGRQIPWDEFGRMLMTFEGWQFRLNIVDLAEEA